MQYRTFKHTNYPFRTQGAKGADSIQIELLTACDMAVFDWLAPQDNPHWFDKRLPALLRPPKAKRVHRAHI